MFMLKDLICHKIHKFGLIYRVTNQHRLSLKNKLVSVYIYIKIFLCITWLTIPSNMVDLVFLLYFLSCFCCGIVFYISFSTSLEEGLFLLATELWIICTRFFVFWLVLQLDEALTWEALLHLVAYWFFKSCFAVSYSETQKKKKKGNKIETNALLLENVP